MYLIANSVVPVCVLIILGMGLKRAQLVDQAFLTTADRLVYYIFFPALLFWKIGSPAAGADVDWRLCLAVIAAVAAVYLVSLLLVRLTAMPSPKIGAFSQCCYRFSSYIGMAIMLTALGDEAVRLFGVVIGFAIPVINFLAVATLVWFGPGTQDWNRRWSLFLKAMFSNPLIVACVLGLGYGRLHLPFPVPLENTFKLLSVVALPLALISIGGSLNFSGLRQQLGYALLACACKHVLLPAVGIACMHMFQVGPLGQQVGLLYFALPTSPAAYILSAQLHSDTDLASATIVLSTLCSLVSLSAAMVLIA